MSGLSGGEIRNPCERMPITCICKIVRCGRSWRVSSGNKFNECAREIIAAIYVRRAATVPDGDSMGGIVRQNILQKRNGDKTIATSGCDQAYGAQSAILLLIC